MRCQRFRHRFAQCDCRSGDGDVRGEREILPIRHDVVIGWEVARERRTSPGWSVHTGYIVSESSGGYHPSTAGRSGSCDDGWREMEQAGRSGSPTGADAPAGERYLLIADISGYTGFMAGVELEHGVDFSAGIPAAYSVLGALLDAVIEGLEPDFALVKLEGDAVFAAAPSASLDGLGDRVLETLGATYRAFTDSRSQAMPANDHLCTACPAVAHLDLKVVLHRGQAVRQMVGSGSDLLGPAVTIAHRLLKNTIRERIGFRPYLFLTDAAATALGLSEVGLAHSEEYADAGRIGGRIVELGGPERPNLPS
jgi:class 3 adenylate cyclase